MENNEETNNSPDESQGEPNNNHTRKGRHRRHKEKLQCCIRWLMVNRPMILLVFGLIKLISEIWHLFNPNHD